MQPFFKSTPLHFGLLAGLLTVVSLLVIYAIDPKMYAHVATQQSVLLVYVVCMMAAMRKSLSLAPDQHWLQVLRSGFLVYVIANVFFYILYFILHQINPQLSEYQRIAIENAMQGRIAEEDIAAAKYQLREANFGSFSTIAFSFARGTIFGFIITGVLAFVTHRLHPGAAGSKKAI